MLWLHLFSDACFRSSWMQEGHGVYDTMEQWIQNVHRYVKKDEQLSGVWHPCSSRVEPRERSNGTEAGKKDDLRQKASQIQGVSGFSTLVLKCIKCIKALQKHIKTRTLACSKAGHVGQCFPFQKGTKAALSCRKSWTRGRMESNWRLAWKTCSENSGDFFAKNVSEMSGN